MKNLFNRYVYDILERNYLNGGLKVVRTDIPTKNRPSSFVITTSHFTTHPNKIF